MTLGIFFPIGDSLDELKKHGKLSRLLDYYLPAYRQQFEEIYIFSYGHDKGYRLPSGCFLVANKWRLHRFIYAFLLPFLHYRYVSKVSVSRVLQLSGVIPALITKLIGGAKVAVTYGYDYREVEKLTGHHLKSLLYVLIDKFILPLVDVVIFSSKTIQRLTKLDNVRQVYFPNGIDLKKFSPGRSRPPKGAFSIMTQSRLSPEKNLGKLIQAIAKIKNQKISLTVIGSGPLKSQLQQQAKQLGVKLTIIDNVSNDDMPRYYNHCNLYVHPSLTEGSSKALIEAAACSCAILAADIPQNREILGTSARYFDLSDSDLSGDIKALIDSPQILNKLGKEARLTIQDKFDINGILRKETKMLQGLA